MHSIPNPLTLDMANTHYGRIQEETEHLRKQLVETLLGQLGSNEQDTLYGCLSGKPLRCGKKKLDAVYTYDKRGEDAGTVTVSFSEGAYSLERLRVVELLDLWGHWQDGQLTPVNLA